MTNDVLNAECQGRGYLFKGTPMNIKMITLALLLLFGIAQTGNADTENNVDTKKPKPQLNLVKDVLDLPFKATEGAVSTVFDLGNIVVSGKRLGSPFHEFVTSTESSTSIVTRKDIELSGVKNLPEALSETPGVILSDLVGNGEEPTFDYRGFNEGQDFIFLLDGVRLNEPKSNNINFPLIPISLVDRIEVSRGGASFLYGEGSMGGVANIVGLFPKENGFHTKVKSLAGSFGEWGENFETSAKQGDIGIYLTSDTYHTRGFRQNTSVEKQDFYTKLIWDISEKAQLGFTYLYANADLDRSGSIRETYLRMFGREATERPRNFSDMESNLGIVDFNFKPLDSVAITSNIFLRKSAELSVANFATFDTNDNELDLDIKSWGFTVQADHSKEVIWGITEGFLAGIDYVNNDISEEDYNRSKATLQRLDQTVDSKSKKEAVGVFSKATLSWNERVGTYYGIRYDDIHFHNNDLINLDNNQPSEVSKVSQSIGVSYQVTQPLALSTTYSHSFRSPTLSDLYANPLFGGNPALKPEESSDYEVGAKWKGDRFLAETTCFLNHRVNEIGFDPNLIDGTHLFGRNNNFGKTERLGIENFFESRPVSWLRLRGSHTYTEAVFKSNITTAEISGDHIPMVPRNRFTSSLLIQPMKDLDLDLNMVSVAKQVLTNDLTNDQNGRRLPSYTVFNFKTIYRIRDWEVSFEVRNLFDEQYESGGSLGGGSVLDNFFVPAPGRSYSGTVSYSW